MYMYEHMLHISDYTPKLYKSPIADTCDGHRLAAEALLWPNGTTATPQLRNHGVARSRGWEMAPLNGVSIGFNGVY